jgi:hypothetical protein
VLLPLCFVISIVNIYKIAISLLCVELLESSLLSGDLIKKTAKGFLLALVKSDLPTI